MTQKKKTGRTTPVSQKDWEKAYGGPPVIEEDIKLAGDPGLYEADIAKKNKQKKPK